MLQAERFQVEMLAPQEVEALHIDGLSLPEAVERQRDLKMPRFGDRATGLQVAARSISLAWNGCRAQAYIMELALWKRVHCKDEDVYIVGSANLGGPGGRALLLLRACVMLVRGESLAATMSKYLIDRIEASA